LPEAEAAKAYVSSYAQETVSSYAQETVSSYAQETVKTLYAWLFGFLIIYFP